MAVSRAIALVVILIVGASPNITAQGANLSLSPYASFLAPTGKSPLAGL